jgi:hypothetical protein
VLGVTRRLSRMVVASRRVQWGVTAHAVLVATSLRLTGCFTDSDIESGGGETSGSTSALETTGSTQVASTSGSSGASTSSSDASTASVDSSSGAIELSLAPVALAVDLDGNGVLDLGEDVELRPAWREEDALSGNATGTLQMCGEEALCDVLDDAAQYVFIGDEATTCTDCYVVRIDLSRGTERPSGDWDLTATETLDSGDEHVWTLHVGPTFPDVPPSSAYYRDIETLVHHGITQGTMEGTFVPGDPINRDAAAQLVANAHVGDDALPTTGDVPGLGAYDCSAGGTSLFEDVAAGSVHCAAVHYIATLGISLACADGPTSFCALTPIERWQLAVFVAQAVAPDTIVPSDYLDPETRRTYDCNPAAPILHFTDVDATHPGCAAIHYLWARGTEDECASASFCPDVNITRAQTARFIARGLALDLYTP